MTNGGDCAVDIVPGVGIVLSISVWAAGLAPSISFRAYAEDAGSDPIDNKGHIPAGPCFPPGHVPENDGIMSKRRREERDMFDNKDFMEFMCFRDMIVEDKIKKCLEDGEDPETMDRSDLINEEVEYVKREVERRRGK